MSTQSVRKEHIQMMRNIAEEPLLLHYPLGNKRILIQGVLREGGVSSRSACNAGLSWQLKKDFAKGESVCETIELCPADRSEESWPEV